MATYIKDTWNISINWTIYAVYYNCLFFFSQHIRILINILGIYIILKLKFLKIIILLLYYSFIQLP